MKKNHLITTVTIIVVLTASCILSARNTNPSFELIKGNNPPITVSPELLKININTASEKEIASLNGIGTKTAKKITDYRNTHGLFSDITDLMNVSGIGEKTFNSIKDHITVN